MVPDVNNAFQCVCGGGGGKQEPSCLPSLVLGDIHGWSSTSFLASHSQSTGCHCVPLCLNALVLLGGWGNQSVPRLFWGEVHCVFCLFLLTVPPQEPMTMRQFTVRAVLAVKKWMLLAIPKPEAVWIVIALDRQCPQNSSCLEVSLTLTWVSTP